MGMSFGRTFFGAIFPIIMIIGLLGLNSHWYYIMQHSTPSRYLNDIVSWAEEDAELVAPQQLAIGMFCSLTLAGIPWALVNLIACLHNGYLVPFMGVVMWLGNGITSLMMVIFWGKFHMDGVKNMVTNDAHSQFLFVTEFIVLTVLMSVFSWYMFLVDVCLLGR